MKKTLKKGGISTRRTNVSSRGRRMNRNIPVVPQIRRQRRTNSRGDTNVLCDDTSAARRNIRTRYPTSRSRSNARSRIPSTESLNSSPPPNVLSGIPNLRESQGSRELFEVRRYMVRRTLYPEGTFPRLYSMLTNILRRLSGIMNNDTFRALVAFFSSQFIMNFANSIYRVLPSNVDDISNVDIIIHSIASNIIMFLLWKSMHLIRLGRPREIINLLYYYVMVERNLRLEEITLENEKEQITEQEYLQRMNILRDKYREWEQLIGRRDRGDEGIPTGQELMNFEEELQAAHASDILEQPQVNVVVNQGSLEDILSQYNTTDTTVALQRAMGNQDRNSIRVIMASRE